MFKYKVNLNYNGRRHSYACTRQFYYINSLERPLDNESHAKDDTAQYWFTQVQSVSSDRRRWTYNIEFFAESVHMYAAQPHDNKLSCDTCTLQDDAIEQEAQTARLTRSEELWDYMSILTTSERENLNDNFFVYDTDNPIALLTQKHYVDTKDSGAKTKKKGKSIHHKLAIVRKRQYKHAKMDAAAKMYALSRSKFVIQDFIQQRLTMTKEAEGFCSINPLGTYQYDRGSIEYAFNHYMDDYRYIRITNARKGRASMYFGLHKTEAINNLFHSTPSMSFDESVELAFNMLNTSVTEKLRARDIYVNTALLSAGLRNRNGAICVSGSMASKVHKSAKLAGAFQPVCSKESIYIGFNSIGNSNMSTVINNSMIISYTDYCLFFSRFIKQRFRSYIFTEDIYRVLWHADGRRHGEHFVRDNAHNITLKNMYHALIKGFLTTTSMIIDYSQSSTFGIYNICEKHNCKTLRHKHRIIVYIDYDHPMITINLAFYLNSVRHIANVSDMLGDHVRSVSMGDALEILTDESIQHFDVAHLQREIVNITGTDGTHFMLNEQFGFNEIDYIVLLRQIRARDYEFLQLHNALCFSYSKLLELSKLSREHNECSRKDSVYFFYIGFLNVTMPSVQKDETLALREINEHMILIGESNVRFKVDVCNIQNKTNSTPKDTEASRIVCGNRSTRFYGTYSERLLGYWSVYINTKRAHAHNITEYTTVSLNMLSCRMHSEYSSISAVFSFADRRPMRIYNAKDIKLSHIDEDVDYVYYRAHSFAVTITGAFTKVLDEFGAHYEAQRKCSHTCAQSKKYCHKCVHNVVFCAKDSVVERYVSVQFEEFIPYIVSLYEHYSFNGGSTEECDLDRKIFEKHHNMLACSNSIEFLYNKDKRKILKLQRELKQKTISVETLNEILNDPSFCLVYIEPINETYGQIKAAHTSLLASNEDSAILSLYNVIMDDYYNKEHAASSIPGVEHNSAREECLVAFIERAVKFENFIDHCLARAPIQVTSTQANTHTKHSTHTQKKDTTHNNTKLYKRTKEHRPSHNDKTHNNTNDSMNEYYDNSTRESQKTQTEVNSSKDVSQSSTHTQHEHIPHGLSAAELEEYAQELKDTVPELVPVYGKAYENYRFAPFENINVEYLGTSKLETNLNRNHSFSCDNIRIQRYSKCHHSFRSPGKLLGSRKRINKPHNIRKTQLTYRYNETDKIHITRAQSLLNIYL